MAAAGPGPRTRRRRRQRSVRVTVAVSVLALATVLVLAALPTRSALWLGLASVTAMVLAGPVRVEPPTLADGSSLHREWEPPR